MTQKELNKEREKCVRSPYYFFTKYCLIDNKKATTHLSEEEFNSMFNSMINAIIDLRKINNKLSWLKEF